MKGIKSHLFFSVVLGIYLSIKQLSQNKHYKILTLKYHGKVSNVTVIQFIMLSCVDNSVCNVNEWWNEGTKKIWFHCLRDICLPCKYLSDYVEFQYKAKDTAVCGSLLKGERTLALLWWVFVTNHLLNRTQRMKAGSQRTSAVHLCLICMGDFNHPGIYQVNTV